MSLLLWDYQWELTSDPLLIKILKVNSTDKVLTVEKQLGVYGWAGGGATSVSISRLHGLTVTQSPPAFPGSLTPTPAALHGTSSMLVFCVV